MVDVNQRYALRTSRPGSAVPRWHHLEQGDTMIKRLVAGAAVAVGLALITLSVWHTKRASAEPQLPFATPTLGQVRETAVKVAARYYDDAAPSAMEEAGSTLAVAARAVDPSGATVPELTDPSTGKPWSESLVDTVTMRGRFIYGGPGPSGSPVPTGTVLTVFIDATSGAVDGEILSETPVDLHEINTTVTALGGST
jgi:hypothetical protein